MTKFKFGIVGIGNRGLYCFGELLKNHPEAEIAALCDTNSYRLNYAREKLQLQSNLYSSLDEMLATEKLDAVIITTPDFYHEECAVKAIRANCNVLVDKPLATSVKACQHIISEAQNAGKVLMVGFNMRHHPVLKKIKEMIDDGIVGRIFLMENREFYDGGRTYMSRWNRFYEKCGGLWIHKGSHDFDIFQWLMNFPKPVRVNAFADVSVLNPQNLPFELENNIEPGPNCHKCHYAGVCKDRFTFDSGEDGQWGEKASALDGYEKDTCMYLSEKNNHDNGIAMVEYDNGARASHMECFITSMTDRKYTICGTKGQIEASLEERKIVFHPRWSQDIMTWTLPVDPAGEGHGGADFNLINSFIDILAGRAQNTTTFEQGMMSTAVGQAAELSRRQHRQVEISELFN